MISHLNHDHQECMELFARMSEYLDEELDVSVCRRIEAHLSRCGPCRVCLQTLNRTIALCHALHSDPVPESLSEHLRNLFSKS
jgi:RNA polymerase sigma-70 factor (ECF subfamily)